MVCKPPRESRNRGNGTRLGREPLLLPVEYRMFTKGKYASRLFEEICRRASDSALPRILSTLLRYYLAEVCLGCPFTSPHKLLSPHASHAISPGPYRNSCRIVSAPFVRKVQADPSELKVFCILTVTRPWQSWVPEYKRA